MSATNSGACGNGVLDPGEACDPKIKQGEGACPKSCVDDACTRRTLVGSSTKCTATCKKETITVCQAGDGCCPAGCNKSNDSDCGTVIAGDGGGGGTCTHASGTMARGQSCVADTDCVCPFSCVKIRNALNQVITAGSCWQACDPKSLHQTCGNDEKCFGELDMTGGCVPEGPLSGGFTKLPVYNYPEEPGSAGTLGSANIALNIAYLNNLQFQSGFGQYYHIDQLNKDFVDVFLFKGQAVDWREFLLITFEVNQNYTPGGAFNIDALDQINGSGLEYHVVGMDTQGGKGSETIRALGRSGKISITEAGKGNKAPVSGTVTSGSTVNAYQEEICGPLTKACVK